MVLYFMLFNMTYVKSAQMHLHLFFFPPHLAVGISDAYSAASYGLTCSTGQMMRIWRITVMCIQMKIMCMGLRNVNYNELITSSVQ